MVRRTNSHLHIRPSIEAVAPPTGHRFSQAKLANTGDNCDNARFRIAHRPTAVRIALSNIPSHA